MVRKVEPARPPISPTGYNGDGATGEDGFTLLEIVCIVAILAILVAILLPAFPYGTSRARLESYAVQAAGLLKADRNAAVRRHTQVATSIDAMARTIRSGATGRVVRVPDDVGFDAVLAARCNDRPAGARRRAAGVGLRPHVPGPAHRPSTSRQPTG